MKKIGKIKILMLVLAIAGIIIIPSIESRTIETNISNSICKKDTSSDDIDCFLSCTITGTYNEELINKNNSIYIKSNTKSIKVKGAALVQGDCSPWVPHIEFRSIKTDKVSTDSFYGTCLEGKIIGNGYWNVYIGNYEPIKAKQKNIDRPILNLFERILKIF